MSIDILQGFRDGLRPVARLSVSEWADKFRVLSSKASAEPGRWRTDRTPYLREIMDRFSPFDTAEEVSIIKGAQLGLSECGFNIVGFYIMQDPCSIMYIMPTGETIEKNSKMRIAPMIEASPELKNLVGDMKSKSSSNTIRQKDFPGGTLILAGANSAAGLRSVPIKVLILDETDAYPKDLDNEGSPIELAKARTRTYAKKKIFYLSTPLIHGSSVIEKKFLEGSQRRYFVPCPHCKKKQYLDWKQIKYVTDTTTNKAKDVHYECINCRKKVLEHHKTMMLDGGEWRDTAPEKANKKHYSYHINSLYSPLGWYSWEDAANEWLDAQTDQTKLKTFVNTVLGETWEEKGEVPEWENLYSRRIDYHTNQPPNEVCIITAGVDVQKDRLELEIVGWGEGKRTWSIDYRVIPGDTSDIKVWNELEKVVDETWTRKDGAVLPLYKMAIDTGYNTTHVYDFCRRRAGSVAVPVKGQANQRTIISQPRGVDNEKRRKNNKHALLGLVLYNVGVSILKLELYGWLKLRIKEDLTRPPGYCEFPLAYDDHFFKMLTAERMVKRIVKGYTVYEWEKIKVRNEALDCRIYARAAASISGMDRWDANAWSAVRNSSTTNNKQTEQPKPKRKSNFW